MNNTNPQPSLSSTSKSYLKNLERITIHANSAILHQATATITVTTESTNLSQTNGTGGDVDGGNDHSIDTNTDIDIDTQQYVFQATIGEFKPHPQFSIIGTLYLSNLIQGTDPITVRELESSLPSSSSKASSSSSPASLLYMERGRNTFIQKSTIASSARIPSIIVQGIICSNHYSTWPYTMKDSTGKGGIVSIVMVQQSDGQIIHSLLKKQQQ